MSSMSSAGILTADEAAALAPAQVVELSRELAATQAWLAGLQSQLD